MLVGQLFRKILPLKSVRSLTVLSKHEDPFVDGLRGLSVLMVVFFHTLYAVNFAFEPEFFQAYLAQFPSVFQFVFGFDKAVDIFFMISAYLLASSLLRQANNNELHVWQFYIHRIMRIYPLFLIALILFGLGDRNFVDKLFYNLFFVDNYFHNTVIPVGWSLSVEMQCYLVLPLLIYLAHRSGSPLIVMWLVFGAAVTLRYGMAVSNPVIGVTPFSQFLTGEVDADIYMNAMYYSTPGRFGSFVVGLIWAYSAQSLSLTYWLARLKKMYWLYSVIFATCLGLIYISMRFPVYIADSAYYQNFLPSLNLLFVVAHRFVFALSLLAIILMVQPSIQVGIGTVFRRVFEWPFWRPFSKMAFPMYLFHFPFIVIGWVIVLGTTDLDTVQSVSLLQTFLAATVSTLLVAWFALPFHFMVELKGIAMGKKWGRRVIQTTGN